jgi:hypothetical protein
MLGVAIRGLVSPASMEGPQTGLGVVIATAFLTCLALACGGIALYGEPRAFSGGLTGTAIEGRIVFSVAFLVVAALAAVFWLLLIARALSSRK